MTPQIKKRIDQIRRGEVPEGYKRTKVGIVPEEWKNKKLGELFAERNDVNCSNEQLLSITADRGVIPRKQIQGKDNSSKDKSKYKHISKGDIGYNTMRMWQGVSAISLYDGIVSPAYTVLKPSAQVNAICFSYLFKLTNMINVFYRHSQGLVDDTRSLKYEWFKSIAVSVPSFAEQEKIAEILQTQDKVIELQQKKIEELKRLKKVYLSKMFPKKGCNVPEIRFPGFTDPWEQREFGDVFVEYSEKNHEELPPLTIIQGKGTILREESDRNLIYDKSGLRNYKLVNQGDFILHLRSFEGGLEIANSRGIVSPAYHLFHSENADSRFYYPFFRSKYFISVLLKPHVYGIRDGKSIDVDGMKSVKIPCPKIEEQKAIGEYFTYLDNLITLHQRKLDEEQKKKKALMQLLLTGIARV